MTSFLFKNGECEWCNAYRRDSGTEYFVCINCQYEQTFPWMKPENARLVK